MAKSKQLFYVYMQGWGDNEDQFYCFGSYSTLAKAEARVEQLLQDWEKDGSSRDDVVYQITEDEMDYYSF